MLSDKRQSIRENVERRRETTPERTKLELVTFARFVVVVQHD
jgi:hypothetical protein